MSTEGWAAFWRGVASIFDLSGSTYRRDVCDPPQRRPSVQEALDADRDAIGRDGLWSRPNPRNDNQGTESDD